MSLVFPPQSSAVRSIPNSRKRRIGVAAAATILAISLSTHATPPPPHNISAANINVVQNDTGNTTNSVTVTAPLSINDLRIRPGSNRGDYNIQIGSSPTNDLPEGMILTAVSENGRDNYEDTGVNYMASAFDGTKYDGTNEFQCGYWIVMQDCTTSRAEYNANCAVAYFRYTNWLCGWARNSVAGNGLTNDLLTASPGIALGTHFKGLGGGKSIVDLREFGIYNTNGVLLVNHAKNEGNFALSQTNDDGTWTLYVKDNNGDNASYEQDPVAFVYIPSTNTTVISGRFDAEENILTYSGDTPQFSVSKIEEGRWRLTIPGYTPETGVLIISAEGGLDLNRDNVVSYQADEDTWIIESRDIVAGQNFPVLETPTNEPVASFVFIPAATPGISLSTTGVLSTSENGDEATFTVVLDTQPTSDVTIGITSSNPTEGTVSPAYLTFTADNCNVPQTVTVTGQDDQQEDGTVDYTITFSPAESLDDNYNGMNAQSVSAKNADNDLAGITVDPISGLTTTETGTATFSVKLNTQPSANVTIGLSSSNPDEGIPTVSSLTFTPENWNIAQIVTVAGIDDGILDGTTPYSIVTAPAVSADPKYNGMDAADVSLSSINVDSVAITLTAGTNHLITIVEGGVTNFTYKLSSKPSANVVISLTSDNTSKGTVSPSVVTFTPENWMTPQSVSFQAIDNLILDGDTTLNIASAITTSDTNYAALSIAKIQITVVDNEALISLPTGDAIYGLGTPSMVIDGRATITDTDTAVYQNGSLTLTLANGTLGDRVALRTNDNINFSGNEVSYNGNVIGQFTGGSDLTPLVFSLNGNATKASVQELIRAITFETPTNTTSFATRVLTVALNDGLGAITTATKNIRVGLLHLNQFQDGADYGYGLYNGENDIALSEVAPQTPWPAGRNTTEGLLVDYADVGTPADSQILIRFDDFVGTNAWQIPTNVTIVTAELLVNVNNTGNGGILYRMLIPWDATNETWSSMGDGVQQDGIESELDYYSQWNVQAGTGASAYGVISIGVKEDIQAWVNGTNNYGWIIRGWPFNTDGSAFSPSEAQNVDIRPRLRVTWIPSGPTETSFRYGVDGYTTTYDTRIRANAPDSNYSTVTPVYVDYAVSGTSDQEQVLLRFDNIVGGGSTQIPAGARIDAAILDLSSVTGNATGNGGSLHALLQSWDDTTSTWNSWGDGIQADGIEAAATPTVTVGCTTNLSYNKMQGGFNSFEVTKDVQNWANGTNNYGWVWLPIKGGSDGWGFSTSEDTTEQYRPRLRVYYSIATPILSTLKIQSYRKIESTFQITFTGTAGKTCEIRRASTLDGAWTTIGTTTTDSNGIGSLIDNNPPASSAFYRVIYQ